MLTVRCGQEPMVLAQTAPEVCHSALVSHKRQEEYLTAQETTPGTKGEQHFGGETHAVPLSLKAVKQANFWNCCCLLFQCTTVQVSLAPLHPSAIARAAQWQECREHQCHKRNGGFGIQEHSWPLSGDVSSQMCSVFPYTCFLETSRVSFPWLHGRGEICVPLWLQNRGTSQELPADFLLTGGHSVNSSLGTCFTVNIICSVRRVLHQPSCLLGSDYEARRGAPMTETATFVSFSAKARLYVRLGSQL